MLCYGNDAEDSLQIYLLGIIYVIKINTLVNRLWNTQRTKFSSTLKKQFIPESHWKMMQINMRDEQKDG